MKKTLLLLLAIVMATTSFAQVPSKSITPTGNEIWWGYFIDDDVNADNYTGYGVSTRAYYEVAIRVGSNHANLGGATVNGVRLWFNSTTIPKITSLKLWIIKTLTKDVVNSANVLYTQEVDPATLTAGANDIALTAPYAINNATTHFGYTVELSAQDNAIMCGGEWETNSFWFRASEEKTNWQAVKTAKLAMQLLVQDAQFPANAASPFDFGTHTFQKGDEAIVPVKIKNNGMTPITSVSYTITTNGDASTTTPEVTVPIDNLPYNGITTIDVAFDTSEAIACTRTITITKVNGVENETPSPQNTAKGQFNIKGMLFSRTPVIEEFTGTWCGWCPRGFVGMETVRETYGDKVVLIAAHNGDPMEVSGYNPIMASSFPTSKINREANVNPHPSTFLDYLNSHMEEYPDGMVEVSAQWGNDEKTAINIEANSRFAYNMVNPNYGIALVLTNDGMKGSGSSWAQANYYNTEPATDPYMTDWYGAGNYISGLTYNFVAVAAWNIKNGFDGSVPASVVAGEPNKFTYLADLTAPQTTNGTVPINVIQDKEQLKVIALLIDRSTGHIINAAHTTIKEMGVEEYYMVGTFNEWNTTEEGGRLAFAATEQAGVYEATGTLEAGAEFKIITPEGDGWKWLGGVDENGVGFFLIYDNLLNVPISLVDGSNFRMENGGEFTFRLNTNDMTLTLLPVGNPVIPGDVNGDGVCNSADVTALYQMILNNDDSKIVNGDQNGDNNINSADVTAVYKIILGSE